MVMPAVLLCQLPCSPCQPCCTRELGTLKSFASTSFAAYTDQTSTSMCDMFDIKRSFEQGFMYESLIARIVDLLSVIRYGLNQ